MLYESAASVVAASAPGKARVLDLGAGTGLLSAALLRRHPTAELLLMDRSEGMLAKARQRFAADPRVGVLVGDLLDPLPPGPFDAVMSGLAIHHLPHPDKRRLFSRIRHALRPGGVFVNVEQIEAPTVELESLYDRQHEEHVHRSGTPADEWAAGRERMKHDICAGLDDQLEWLRDAGFGQVDCLAKDWRFATYAGWTTR
ncbi:class I SAM-dependent methyltransferase [Streptomyces sp. NPDC050504]|uniref:class I SAM-dependent methyltransferase n=1 Tax=Streptomyces sp. NPDC050504 TaxID=3365618 RepID=UPI0037979C9F